MMKTSQQVSQCQRLRQREQRAARKRQNSYSISISAILDDLLKANQAAENAGDSWRDMQKLEKLKANKDFIPTSSAKTYEVNINADPSHFLDWDKPLSEHSDAVLQSIINSSLPEKAKSSALTVEMKT